MDVWNSQWIDPGLTVLGYLLAGSLGALIYAARRGRRPAESTTPQTNPAAESRPTPAGSTAPRAARPTAAAGQFVSLRSPAAAPSSDGAAVAESPSRPAGNHRDRPEIIRLAREMLKKGTPPRMIRRTLPITEAELTLLQHASNK